MRHIALLACFCAFPIVLVAEDGQRASSWQPYLLTTPNDRIFSTVDWSNFEIIDWVRFKSKSAQTSYPAHSFQYPADWQLKYSVFYSSDGLKIAELAPPGLVSLNAGQTCFDSYKADEPHSQVLMMKPLSIGNLQGKKILQKSRTESEFWYSHWYCLSDGRYAFGITFYERKLNSGLEQTFDRIVSTFKLVNVNKNQ